MLTQTDAKSQTTTFVYDELGRLKTRADHPGTAADTTTWVWDGPNGVATLYNKGQLYSVTSPGGYSDTYAYDTKARRSGVTTGTASGTFVMNYGYDASLGSLSTVTYPASTGTPLTVSYSYQNGFTKDVRDASTGGLIWQANAQDSRGHVTQEQYGNGQITNLGFDQTNGRLYTIQTGTNTATQNLSYAWDRVGNLTSRRDNNQGLTESFSYDAVYRVASVQLNNGTPVTTSYDVAGIGNVANKSDVGSYDYTTAQAGCTYYSNAQPHAVRKVGTNVYCYDANGSMVSRSGATVTWSTYNYPLTINDAGGNTSTFSYGADRNRYRTISVDGGVTEDKLEIGGGAFEKVVSGTNIQYRYNIQINGKAVAIVARNATTSAPTTLISVKSLYLHEDHLGSLDVITDDTNTVVLRTSFDAWGKRRGSNWTGAPSAADKAAIANATRKGYTGHQQLDNLNLVHMNARVYDPVIARFMSADPIIQDPYHSQAFNRYSYVWNNPLNLTDPTGNATESTEEGRNDCKASRSTCRPEPCTGSRVITDCNKSPDSSNFLPERGDGTGKIKNGNGSAAPSSSQQTADQTGGNNSAQVNSDEQNQSNGGLDQDLDKQLQAQSEKLLAELRASLPLILIDEKFSLFGANDYYVYTFSAKEVETARNYLKSSVPKQMALTGKERNVEHFGKTFLPNGKTVDGVPTPGDPYSMQYSIMKSDREPAGGNVFGTGDDMNAHVHPDDRPLNVSSSDADKRLSHKMDVFTGNTNGEFGVLPKGSPTGNVLTIPGSSLLEP